MTNKVELWKSLMKVKALIITDAVYIYVYIIILQDISYC